MLLSAVSVLVVAQSSSEVPVGLMNNPVVRNNKIVKVKFTLEQATKALMESRCIALLFLQPQR